MVFGRLTNDVVTLVKEDGTVDRQDIKCQVSPGLITIFDKTLQIQPNDHLVRTLENGLGEDYVVVDPVFFSGLSGIPANYQVKVRRSDVPPAPAQTVIHNITNNVTGPNARVSINSVDNSTNTNVNISTMKLASFLGEIQPHIQSLPEPQRSQVAAPIELLESEMRSGSPDQAKVTSALISLKTILEGVASGVIASGIVGLIGKMLEAGMN